MPQQQIAPDGDDASKLVPPANTDKMAVVNELLGIEPEQDAKPEKAELDTETDKTVSELLAEAEKPPDSGENQKTIKPPKTLDELAEMAGVKVDDLYAIELPAQADGVENPTFGSLKDLAAQQSDFAGRELQFEERRVEFGNEQAKARKELELVLQSLPKDAIKPAVLEAARKERETMLDLEAVRTLDVIPDWKSDEAKRADLAGIGEHMEQYGFDKSHIDRIADHKMLRYMRDNYIRLKLVEKALAGVKPIQEVPKGKHTQPARAKPKIVVTPASTQDEKLNAIDDILNIG